MGKQALSQLSSRGYKYKHRRLHTSSAASWEGRLNYQPGMSSSTAIRSIFVDASEYEKSFKAVPISQLITLDTDAIPSIVSELHCRYRNKPEPNFR